MDDTCRYSKAKSIQDGEPLASEIFSVGGHEWVSATSFVLSMVVSKRHDVLKRMKLAIHSDMDPSPARALPHNLSSCMICNGNGLET